MQIICITLEYLISYNCVKRITLKKQHKNVNINVRWTPFLNLKALINPRRVEMSLKPINLILHHHIRPPTKRACPGYDIKLHLIMRIQFWRSWEYGVLLRCHYSHVHSDPDRYYLIGSYLWVKKTVWHSNCVQTNDLCLIKLLNKTVWSFNCVNK